MNCSKMDKKKENKTEKELDFEVDVDEVWWKKLNNLFFKYLTQLRSYTVMVPLQNYTLNTCN